MKTILLILLSLVTAINTWAGSATWNLHPENGSWSTPANWIPRKVPNGSSDIAMFGVSNVTNISNAGFSLSEMIFSAGASAYTIAPVPLAAFQIEGPGITNNSGILQKFVIGPGDASHHTSISFINGASAGALTQFTNLPSETMDVSGGLVSFYNSASAGSATFINIPRTNIDAESGLVYFADSSTAATATFINSGGIEFDGDSTGGNATVTNEGSAGVVTDAIGSTVFFSNSNAGNGTYIANDGVTGANGGFIQFSGTSSAANATLIANGGTGGGPSIVFYFGSPSGGTARVELFGNAFLDITFVNPPGTTIGSLEGDGTVFVGSDTLTIGSNNLATAFSGIITDFKPFGGSGGGIAKLGTGTLTLTGANTYPGGTAIAGGTLIISNTAGSGTGSGPVQVSSGTLGGSGIISGAVTVGPGAFLAPAAGRNKQVTLTLQSNLTLQDGATYTYTFKARNSQSRTDLVIANGVTINGATIRLKGKTQGTLTAGTVLTLISNPSANPISGTFSNLADGAIVTVNGNNLQASYSGGDGNDLTLTVVP